MAKHFKNLAVFTPQDFKIMIGHFTTLCMKRLITPYLHTFITNMLNIPSDLPGETSILPRCTSNLKMWPFGLVLRHTICNPVSSVFVGCTVSTLIYLGRAPFAFRYTSLPLVQSFANVPFSHYLLAELPTVYQDNI